MKTVPSLVASSTVGVAVAGLAFGRPERESHPRPSSKKRKATDFADLQITPRGDLTSSSRPATSSTIITPESRTSRRTTNSSQRGPIIHQQPTVPRASPPNISAGRRLSVVRSGEFVTAHDHFGEDLEGRVSSSSGASWMKRLSTRPNSHNNSPRSSIGPDSPSVNLSHGSAAPILQNPNSSPAQLPPNKLVKRATSSRATSGPISRTRSISHLPTLRRPATSHQRTVTLQQQFREDSTFKERPSVLETPVKQLHSAADQRLDISSSKRIRWHRYFESRPTKLTKDRTSGASTDGIVQNNHSMSKRVVPDEATQPTLIKPALLGMSREKAITRSFEDSYNMDEGDKEIDSLTAFEATPIRSSPPTTEEVEPQKRPRRSLSMHFTSPGLWIPRSGSLRGKKGQTGGGGQRNSSAPDPTVRSLAARSTTSHSPSTRGHRAIMDPSVFQQEPNTTSGNNSSSEDPFSSSFHARTRNTSSPLPPLSRLSSFNLDLARLGLSSSSSSAPHRSPTPTSPLPATTTTSTSISSAGHISPSSASANYFISQHPKAPRTSDFADRASTLVGSDNDTRGFTSGDEDDLDFQSETVFDSLRSGVNGTGSTRSQSRPIELMFDEAPPSVNGLTKNKRLSIHEMLVNGGFQDGTTRIVEEDEGMSTPVKGSRAAPVDEFATPVRLGALDIDQDFPSSPPGFSLATKDFSHLSLDDEDDDEDWTRDDENMDIGNLSPPSSMNSRKLSPGFRTALADVTHSGSTKGNSGSVERPKSNLFDWAEPSSAEKVDHMGNSPRPKTAHVKQIADGRGGRPGRRGPSALHIRSQSVPVVPIIPDIGGQPKTMSKFRTWGLAAKGVSEDWDNDFDFDGLDTDELDEGDSKLETSGMLVPQAIQASQASVVGHVGQIREVCLLVEDLKRLRALAKEKGLLTGDSAHLWKEAEGIIALAVPDEEETVLPLTYSPDSTEFDHDAMTGLVIDHGPKLNDVEISDASSDGQEEHDDSDVFNGIQNRRRSVFSPEDDIFGAAMNSPPSREYLRPPATSTRNSSMRSASEVARSVMENMHQHRSMSDPMLVDLTSQASNKMPFDTTSLRDLVHKANVLARTLGDIIRKADGASESPVIGPHRESSPAFTRVFTDPMQTPSKHLPRSHSNPSVLGGSIDDSPTRSLGQRMHMMTVV